jgi:hypothetical protein
MGANGVFMNSRVRVIVVAAVMGMPCLTGTAALASTHPQGSWGTAQRVPGVAALNKGDFAQVLSISCASAGNCSAGGTYKRSGATQAFVVSEVNGTWGTAIEVPGTAALNAGGHSEIASVSCASAGNCGGGGYYLNSSHQHQAFVSSEVNGTWGTATAVPGITALNSDGTSAITAVSCASPGNCTAGGYYPAGTRISQAFVVSQVDGTWSDATAVPGAAALNHGEAQIASVSCASAGNCSAGGYYADSSGDTQAFVVNQASGIWGTATELPGTVVQGDNAAITSVSCGSAGNCSAAGYYQETPGFVQAQAFVVSEVSGTWGTAIEVPGTAALNTGGSAEVYSVSCVSAGNCSAGGYYDSTTTGTAEYQAFVVSEVSGTWGTAIEMPGTAALNKGGYGIVRSVSCASAGNCSAGGDYENSTHISQAFVDSEVNGTWHKAIEVPGTAALNTGGHAGVQAVSCAPAGTCSAGGDYQVLSTRQDLQVFVDSHS